VHWGNPTNFLSRFGPGNYMGINDPVYAAPSESLDSDQF